MIDQATTLHGLGYSLWHSGNLQAAQATFELLLNLAQTQECETLEASAWNSLAVVLRERGESARAAVCQQHSWRASLNDTSADSFSDFLSQNLTNLANDAILAGDYGFAERLLWSALDIDVRTGNSADEAADWGSLGIVASQTGQFLLAHRYFTMALQIHERLGDDRGLGLDLGHLGQLSLAGEDWLSARNFIERSVFHFERAHCRLQAQRARRTLREIASRQRVANFNPVRN